MNDHACLIWASRFSFWQVIDLFTHPNEQVEVNS